MSEVYSVIVIGPLDDPRLERIKKTVPVSKHISNICEAAERCGHILKRSRPGLRLDVRSCHDVHVDGITPAVMRMMDQADFAIADISQDSPATQYEIATLHAMGIPTIFLDYKYASGDRRQISFYLKDQYQYCIDEYKVEQIAESIFPAIEGTIKNIDAGQPAINPISEHYNKSSLIEASPIAGLAIGQFYNFIRHVVGQSGAIVKSRGRYTKLIAIQPRRLQEAAQCLEMIKESLPREFETRVRLPVESHERDEVTVATIDRTIVDFPTPLSAVAISAKYKAFAEFVYGESIASADARMAQFEQRIIDRYFNLLRRLVRDQPGTRPDLFFSMPVDEVIEAAQRGEL